MTAPLRVLYYNWVDYLDPEGRGGGVTLYQANLMRALGETRGVEAVFLSAGVSHDLRRRAPRWERVRHGPDTDRGRRFEIVNSGVLAPAHHSFGDAAQLSHPATRDVFFDFIERNGPFDVVHFNNLEGLPADALALRERWPQMRVVLSLHNYYAFCPQVNLWHNERRSCEDFGGGARCIGCLPHRHDGKSLRLADAVAYRMKRAGVRPGGWAFDGVFRFGLRPVGRALRILGKLRRKARAPRAEAAFAERRRRMVETINRNCTDVLCVSDAVRTLAERYGISAELTRTGYIGTRAAELFAQTAPAPKLPKSALLTLGFLGYMRRDKGFYFLLGALEALPAQIARRIKLVVAARAGGREAMDRLAALRGHLGDVVHHDGYTHDALDGLLAEVDVGVVPMLWHDNLPQVAIEMHARHIPLLVSDMGGASELGRCADMVFTAGSMQDFARCITRLLSGEIDMDAYWRGAMPPPDMRAHVADLLHLYRSSEANVVDQEPRRRRTKGTSDQRIERSAS
ncbi:glycosyltransferase [Roseovarius aquimarinus]|uniref:Glycosyltransferase n=1 Tax=Roseovarius aquimarinus TaxID=1229156 RepID=A0ABW7IAL3_9RHOB